jgi:hypothetical protein
MNMGKIMLNILQNKHVTSLRMLLNTEKTFQNELIQLKLRNMIFDL